MSAAHPTGDGPDPATSGAQRHRHVPSPVPIEIRATDDPGRALDDAGDFLRSRPAVHNAHLTLLHARVSRPEAGRYWTAVRRGEVVGFTAQSPTDVIASVAGGPVPDRDAMVALADSIATAGVPLPGAVGDAGATAAFAGAWSERTHSAVTDVEAQRIYRLQELQPAVATGRLRLAGPADLQLLTSWRGAFHAETFGEGPDPGIEVRGDLALGRLFVWDTGTPVATGRLTPTIAGLTRIGYVYTPPEHRGHGYAAALTSGVCRWVEGHDRAGVVLFTQLANLTSNAIYRRLGFEVVTEVLAYRFAGAGAE